MVQRQLHELAELKLKEAENAVSSAINEAVVDAAKLAAMGGSIVRNVYIRRRSQSKDEDDADSKEGESTKGCYEFALATSIAAHWARSIMPLLSLEVLRNENEKGRPGGPAAEGSVIVGPFREEAGRLVAPIQCNAFGEYYIRVKCGGRLCAKEFEGTPSVLPRPLPAPSDSQPRQVPKRFLCRLSGILMRRPGIASDGFHYDLSEIRQLFADSDRTPRLPGSCKTPPVSDRRLRKGQAIRGRDLRDEFMAYIRSCRNARAVDAEADTATSAPGTGGED